MKKGIRFSVLFFFLFAFSLNAQSLLNGIVFSSAQGIVYPDIKVVLYQKKEVVQRVKTDSLGRYRFYVAPGMYTILVDYKKISGNQKVEVEVLKESEHYIVINLEEKQVGHPHMPNPPSWRTVLSAQQYQYKMNKSINEPSISEQVIDNYLSMKAERAFMSTLPTLPNIFPFPPSATSFNPGSYFQKMFIKNRITFLDIKDTLAVIAKRCAWDFEWSYYVVDSGLVCVAMMHPISPDGGHIPANVRVRNHLYYYTWNDVFHLPDLKIWDERSGYARIFIFAFTNASFDAVGKGDERVAPSDLKFLDKRVISMDHGTEIGTIKRNMPCKVFTFTFKYDDMHDIPVLESKPDAMDHLTITGILNHLTKWH